MTPRPTSRRDSGFTLVEVMVAGGLLAVVLTGAMLMLITVNNAAERVRRVGDAQGTARAALDMLEAELRGAGVGASIGNIGLAPGGGPVLRVPVIYSEADQTVTTPGGASITTSSVFIISAEPASVGITADGVGMQGVVTSAAKLLPMTVYCADGTGAVVQCDDTTFKESTLVSPLGGGFAPIIVSDDFHWSVMVTPTLVGPSPLNPLFKLITFAEQTNPAFAPFAKTPFGFGHAAHLMKARVTHWWLRRAPAPAPAGIFELVRSRPTLNTAPFPALCDPANPPKPFLDKTNGGTEEGVAVGSGPIDGLLVRYVLGTPDASDRPANWTIAPNPVTPCDSLLSQRLREVRVGVVARAVRPDTDDQANGITKYSLPPMEGVTMINVGGVAATPAQIKSTGDAYPRRSFLTRVVPRNALGYLP